MKFCLVSLGCQMNLSDSERVGAVLERIGLTATENEEEADILGLVACSVRQRAIDRAYARIQKWNEWKKRRNLLTFATGCVLPADRDRFDERFDLFLPINELPQLPDMIRQYGVVTPISTGVAGEINDDADDTDTTDPDRDFWRIRPSYVSDFDAYVPIQNGCDKFCSFCAVPYTRGREVSRPSGEVIEEIENLVESGYKSITLLGQNVNSYGLDNRSEEIDFPELLMRIGELGEASGKQFWVHFTSPHPRDMSRRVVEVISRYEHLAKQIHLPLQSGDDKMLIRMNRNYTVERYREVVSNIRSLIPEATLFTDIIVGFPGETQEQFEGTRQAMLEFRYNMAYIAMYSPRPGARSARWEDDVPSAEKKRRLHELSALLKGLSFEYNTSLIGREVTILVQGHDRDTRYLTGRTEGRIIVRFPSDDSDLIGTFQRIRITEAAEMSVQGDLTAVPTNR